MPTDLLPLVEQAGRNQWLAIAPELMLGLIALLLLVLELVLPKAQRGLIPGIAIVSQIAVLVALIINLSTPYIGAGPTFNGLLQHTGGGQFLRIFFLLASILTCVLGTVSLPGTFFERCDGGLPPAIDCPNGDAIVSGTLTSSQTWPSSSHLPLLARLP